MKKYVYFWSVAATVVVAVGIIVGIVNGCEQRVALSGDKSERLERFMEERGYKKSDYPKELLELYKANDEAEEFVLNYPAKKYKTAKTDLGEYKNSKEVPLFMQWDSRWGYKKYGDGVMGLTGCGPTCLSMVAVYLKNDIEKTPAYIADFAEGNGYCVYGSGSSWKLMSEGAKELGLKPKELPLDKNIIFKNLRAGNPIICIMGEGDFTSSGHYIVLKGISGDKIKINDPNSRARSEKLWEYEKIAGQIRNLWVYTK